MCSTSQEKKQPDIYYIVYLAINFSYGSHIFVANLAQPILIYV